MSDSSSEFQQWVAATVHAVSGIWPEHLARRPALDWIGFTVPARICGVYMLYLGDKLQYIGQSRSIMERVAAHTKMASFDFDSVRVFPCAEADLTRKEAEAIRTLEPPCNREYPSHGGLKHEYRGPHKRSAAHKALNSAGGLSESKG